MAESRQKKARRLAAEYFNEFCKTEETGEANADDFAIIMQLLPASKDWTIVLIMKKPVVMYWEIQYSSGKKAAVVRPYGPLRQGFYPDQPAPAKLKAVRS
jgi:hypothetical protein